MTDFSAGVAFMVIYFVVVFGVSVTMYLLQAFGIYRMGQNLGFKNTWLAFVPVANIYAFGKVAEQYVKNDGKKSAKFSKILLALNIAMMAFVIIFIVAVVVLVIVNAGMFAIDGGMDEAVAVFTILLPIVLGYLVLLGLAIAQSVVYYIALWRIFAIFDNNNATLFLVLSVFFSFLYPVFLFILRNKVPKLTPQERFSQI